MSVSAGVVCVTEFCLPQSSAFTGYINYIDREEAVREANMDKHDLFSEYQEYMGDEEKSSGLFTKKKDQLSDDDKKALKVGFTEAQENGSLMWQTVYSFDNKWLSDMGLYDRETNILDSERVKVAARAAVETMLEKEGLKNALWSAAIHYNTDNFHVHVAIVEPVPSREQKEYIQYEKEKVDGKWQYKKEKDEKTGRLRKIPLRDQDGKIIKRKEYKGRFKESSIRAGKTEIVKELTGSKEANSEINSLIKEKIVKNAREKALFNDKHFRKKFMELYDLLPRNVDRNLWSYNAAVMADLRPKIDEITGLYINMYHKDDFDRLRRVLERQSDVYKAAYGGNNEDYAENKLKDLYSRMGNAILSELKEYDRNLKATENRIMKSEQYNGKGPKTHVTVKGALQAARNNQRDLQRAMIHLRRSLEHDYRNWRNLSDYERLQNEISNDAGPSLS